MSKFLWLAIFVLVGGAATASVSAREVLSTDTYTLTVVAHCDEGEVGCAKLSATLLDHSTGRQTELVGSTYMVMCADRVTPCHIGFYDPRSPGLSLRAYPDGTLEIQPAGSRPGDVDEHGTWSY